MIIRILVWSSIQDKIKMFTPNSDAKDEKNACCWGFIHSTVNWLLIQ